jgi:hypothetical protein
MKRFLPLLAAPVLTSQFRGNMTGCFDQKLFPCRSSSSSPGLSGSGTAPGRRATDRIFSLPPGNGTQGFATTSHWRAVE